LLWSSYITNSTLRFCLPISSPPRALTCSRQSSYAFNCEGAAAAKIPVLAMEKPILTGFASCARAVPLDAAQASPEAAMRRTMNLRRAVMNNAPLR